ncbi:MAG: hypothetical protein AB1427_08820 [Thermodesulfobacteriota bacterium]
MNSHHFKTQKSISAVLLFATVLIIINSTALLAQEQTDPEAAAEGVKVEQVNDHQWNIINKDSEFVGTLKSENLQTFTFYNTSGVLIGTILGSGAWQPRLYRSRETLIQPDEARLYLDALEATKLLKK